MADAHDTDATKAARWAKAEKYAQGHADHGMGRALTIYYTRYFPLISLAAFGLAVAIASLRASGGPLDWSFIGWAGTYFFALGAVIGGLTYNSRHLKPVVELGSTLSIVMPLENDEQKAFTRGINGKQPVPDEHLTIARSLAIQARKNTATWLLIGPIYTPVFGPAFSSPSTLVSFGWYYLVVLALMITLLILGITSFRRHGRFLATTASRTSAEQA